MKLNFNFDGKTFLSKWWKIVRDNFTAIQTDHNTLSDKLDTEITQRTNADVGLANQIAAEKTARESADSSLSSRINNEATIRQAADNELQRNIDSEITERQTADSKKADKTELYGTDETTKHTVTYSLTAADMAVSIDAGHSTGTVTVAGNTVKSKILLDGYSIQAADLSATFGCGKGEDGDKYICIYYSPETGTLTMTVEDVETSPEEGTIALMTVGYNTATVTTMYNRAQTFTGINNLNGLKTNNKNSFLEAVNEIATKLTTEISDRMDENDSLSDRINTETGERQAADMQLSARINSIGNKAPLNHASTGTTYGVGDATNYGHLKLSDSVSSSNSTSNGCAATPKATKTAYDKAVEAYELANQNQYTHPSTHPASMIVQDSTHRFVSDDEISDWDSKLGAQDEIYDGWTLWDVAESVSDISNAFSTNSFAGAGEIVEKLADAMRSATIVVGASNSKYHSANIHSVDYECTGTNDQTVINNAISALPSTGGKIVLLEGTYNISGQINVNKPNVTICGMGNSTVLQRKFNGNNVIYVTSANCELAYFKVDGDSATYTNTANCNIQMYGAGYQNIHDITTVNATDCGIKIRNVCHYSNIYNISADGNKIGILFDGTTGAKICKNTVTNSTATGILLSWNTRDCVVAENVVDTATTYGICIENTNSCIRNVVANNVVRNSATNIYVNNSYNIVACNMVEPETGQKTIHVGSSGKYNYVTGNYIYSINYTNDGGTTNTFSNNKYS